MLRSTPSTSSLMPRSVASTPAGYSPDDSHTSSPTRYASLPSKGRMKSKRATRHVMFLIFSPPYSFLFSVVSLEQIGEKWLLNSHCEANGMKIIQICWGLLKQLFILVSV